MILPTLPIEFFNSNLYQSSERVFSLLNQIWLGWSLHVCGLPFKMMSDSPVLHSRWLLLLTIDISSIVYAALL
jgi:hypothetical protein